MKITLTVYNRIKCPGVNFARETVYNTPDCSLRPLSLTCHRVSSFVHPFSEATNQKQQKWIPTFNSKQNAWRQKISLYHGDDSFLCRIFKGKRVLTSMHQLEVKNETGSMSLAHDVIQKFQLTGPRLWKWNYTTTDRKLHSLDSFCSVWVEFFKEIGELSVWRNSATTGKDSIKHCSHAWQSPGKEVLLFWKHLFWNRACWAPKKTWFIACLYRWIPAYKFDHTAQLKLLC